jgi:hypothetical protein
VTESIPEHTPGVARACIPCPISACGWHYDEQKSDDWTTSVPIEPDADTIAQCGGDAMQAAIYATVHDQMLRVDDILRTHFETHALEEWVTEVVRLRGQIADQAPASSTWVRPSEERIENGVQELVDLVRAARDVNSVLDVPDSTWEPTKRQRDRFRTIAKHVLRADAKYRFEHSEELA